MEDRHIIRLHVVLGKEIKQASKKIWAVGVKYI